MEAEICKTETMNKTMSGKNYYVMLGCHTPMNSAVFKMSWILWFFLSNKFGEAIQLGDREEAVKAIDKIAGKESVL